MTGNVEYVALKQQDETVWKVALKERNVLCHLNSDHVVKMLYAFQRFGYSYIATELCRGRFTHLFLRSVAIKCCHDDVYDN